MILAFEFHYVSNNGILEALLNEIAEKAAIQYSLVREDSNIILFVEGDESTLTSFADTLAVSLPLSIFFKSSSVYVAESMPLESNVTLKEVTNIEFKPSLLASLDTTKAPFVHSKSSDVVVKNSDGIVLKASNSEEYVKLYVFVAEQLSQNKTVKVVYGQNSYYLGNVNALKESGLKAESFEIVATDLSVIERMVVIRENEIKALASLERPAIRLKVNAFFAQKEILPSNRVFLRLSDDLFLYQLSKVLFESGVQFIYRTQESIETAYSVEIDAVSHNNSLKISVFENGEIVILEGDSYAPTALKESLNKFDEPSHASFASIMQEHKLFDFATTCFYLSTKHNDRFMHYSKEHGMLNLVEFPIPESFEALFAEIVRSNPNAERLVENYKVTFADIYQKALSIAIPQDLPKSMYSLMGIVAVVLGIADSLEEGAAKLMENAEDFGGQKGPRMDYHLQKSDALSSDFDYVRLIKSAMSYKMAETDDVTLCFGILESLAFFLSDQSDAHKEGILSARIAFGGSLFGYKRLSEMVIKNIKPNHTICMNRELPIEC